MPAFAVAMASGADFIRVNQWANAYVANEGFVEGKAGLASRCRSWIGARDVKIFADVHVKHGAHAIVADRPLPEMARDGEFFDAIASLSRASVPDTPLTSSSLPVLVGSGVNKDNVTAILGHANAVIVASSLKTEGKWWYTVDEQRVRDFMAVVGRARE